MNLTTNPELMTHAANMVLFLAVALFAECLLVIWLFFTLKKSQASAKALEATHADRAAKIRALEVAFESILTDLADVATTGPSQIIDKRYIVQTVIMACVVDIPGSARTQRILESLASEAPTLFINAVEGNRGALLSLFGRQDIDHDLIMKLVLYANNPRRGLDEISDEDEQRFANVRAAWMDDHTTEAHPPPAA